jgi:hypothetical protein
MSINIGLLAALAALVQDFGLDQLSILDLMLLCLVILLLLSIELEAITTL